MLNILGSDYSVYNYSDVKLALLGLKSDGSIKIADSGEVELT